MNGRPLATHALHIYIATVLALEGHTNGAIGLGNQLNGAIHRKSIPQS
jgi:hypothetical protein